MRLTRVAGAVAAVCGLLATVASAAPSPPRTDPFYRAPHSLASRPLGAILRWRRVAVSVGGVPLNTRASAYQLLYRSQDATGRPVANVTTIIVPHGRPPAEGRQLISLNDAEDSLDPNCAPSYQLQIGEQQNHNLQAELTLSLAELGLGRDLVIPDAEGPRSEYIVTGMEGHATLDSIRAVERFHRAELHGLATRVALIGYSGGAHVSAAADELQPAYAPGLRIVGVAAGGVPVGNRQTFTYIDGGVATGVLMATAIALDRAFPQMNLFHYLNAKGRAFAKQVMTGCASSVFAAPYAHFNQWTTVRDPIDLPSVARIIARNALGHATPRAPTFFYNGIHDEIISIGALDKLVGRYCKRGARLQYYRDPTGFEHIQGVANFFPLALSYLSERFAAQPVPAHCTRGP